MLPVWGKEKKQGQDAVTGLFLEKLCWFIKVIIHAVNLYQHSSSDTPESWVKIKCPLPWIQHRVHKDLFVCIRVVLATLGAEVENVTLRIFLLIMRSLSKRTAWSCDTNCAYCLWSIHWVNIWRETKIEVGKLMNWRQDGSHSDALALITGLLISWQRKRWETNR